MGTSLTTISAATTADAADIKDRIATIEGYLNGGIAVADLDATEWVDYTHIFKPDFYGSPAPRMEAVSRDEHYRYTDGARSNQAVFHSDMIVDKPIAIPGLCATIRNPYQTDKRCIFVASWYAYEAGGSDTSSEGVEAGTFSVRKDGTAVAGTSRSLYNTGGYDPVGRKQFSAVTSFLLTPGTHNVGVYYTPNAASFTTVSTDMFFSYRAPNIKHVFVRARSMMASLYALG
jgi:hypothetical protein